MSLSHILEKIRSFPTGWCVLLKIMSAMFGWIKMTFCLPLNDWLKFTPGLSPQTILFL